MKEIDYYEEFSVKFVKYLDSYLGHDFKVYYSCNNTLDVLIKSLEEQSGFSIKPSNSYIPKLKVDIVFAVCKANSPVSLILTEVKYLPQLSLKDYSQLTGYLQVGKIIDTGLLLLIQKENAVVKLSNDFQEIVRLKKLPMNWIVDLRLLNEQHSFRTGIISYIPNNGIDWIDTNELNGISSFEDLAKIFER